jgi:hypothetical protein
MLIVFIISVFALETQDNCHDFTSCHSVTTPAMWGTIFE